MTTEEAVKISIEEMERAVSTHGTFNSAHEGYAVILEEIDELWEEVKKKRTSRNVKRLEQEAKQIAAMAIRFLIDIC